MCALQARVYAVIQMHHIYSEGIWLEVMIGSLGADSDHFVIVCGLSIQDLNLNDGRKTMYSPFSLSQILLCHAILIYAFTLAHCDSELTW